MKGSSFTAGCALLLLAFGTLAACGGSGSATTDTAAPSPAATVTVSPTPTPTPTHAWPPGAKPIPAATFPAQEATTDVGEASFGWSFQPTVDVQVTHLGYYDDAGNGLRHAHPVGIFDMGSEKLLARVTVKPHSPLEASYRFAKIKPLTLRAGRMELTPGVGNCVAFDTSWAPSPGRLRYT